MRTLYLNKLFVAILLLVATIMVGCNRQFPSQELKSGANNQSGVINKKVLFIVVDGAVGTEVKAANPITLNSLVDFSTYSWDALESYDNTTTLTNENAWSTVLTGVKSSKHQVTSSDFTTNNFANYPSIFTRVKAVKPAARSVAYVTSQPLIDNLAADATEKKVLADDAAVKDAVVTELKSTSSPQLVFANFSSIDKAGITAGYSITNAAYKTAITTVDGYIGEILTALRARPTFKVEDWLIIITSNKGSNTGYDPGSKPWSAFDDKRFNTFFFSFNPRFLSAAFNRPTVIPYIGNTQSYSTKSADAKNYLAKATTAGTLYDVGADKDFSVQCKVKIPNGTGANLWPAIIGKTAGFDGASNPGWCIYLSTVNWSLNFYGSGGGRSNLASNAAVCDGAWHTLTFVIKKEGNARNAYLYTDGVKNSGPTDIAGRGNINNNAPFTVGTFGPNYSPNIAAYQITDIRIYNTALDATYISNNYCRSEIPDGDIYKSNLLGFWPSTTVQEDDAGYYFADMSGNNNALRLGTLNPNSFNEVTTRVCPPVITEVYKSVPNSVDVVPQIFDWLGIGTQANWGLDGKYWIPKYNDLSN